MKLVHEALDEVRRALVRALDPADPARRATKKSRFVLQKRPGDLLGEEVFKLADIARENKPLYRAYLMKEKLAGLLDNVEPVVARRALTRGATRPSARASRRDRSAKPG